VAGHLRAPASLYGFAAVVLAIFAFLTWRQSAIYTDLETLWRDTLAKNPACPMAHDELGLVLDKAGEVAEAQEHFEHALRIKPDFAEAHDNLGTILVRAGRVQEGIAHMTQAMRIDPDYDLAPYNLGIALAQTGKFEEAVGCYEQALRINPDFLEAHNRLAEVLARLGRVPEAMTHWERVLQLNPDFPEAHNNLGIALMRAGRLTEAVAHFEEAVQIKPDYAKAHDNLARLLAALAPTEGGDPVRAVDSAQRACELTDNQTAGYVDTLAITYAAAGRFEDAIATAQRAIDLAQASGQLQLAGEIEGRLELYRNGRPYHQSFGGKNPQHP
jgi:tetratricopeptide (TPR) repeat protein